MRTTLFTILTLLSLGRLDAQYYYSDIVATKQTNQLYKNLRTANVKKISATSFDGNEPIKEFLLEQLLSSDGKQITTHSASIGNAESYFISNFVNNRVVKTVDSSTNAIVTVLYQYDNQGRVSSINSTSKDFDGTFMSSEVHVWTYNEKGLPIQMLKIKNDIDTTNIAFAFDENDNVVEENWKRNNRTTESYYYYYNDKKQLTDVVRFNAKAKRKIPDYVLEYDNAGRISQMTQTQPGVANYLIWKYNYNENGLKQREVVYNKQKELLGRIEYQYR